MTAAPGTLAFDALLRHLLCDPDELREFLTVALDAYDRDGDAAALRQAVAVARDAPAGADEA